MVHGLSVLVLVAPSDSLSTYETIRREVLKPRGVGCAVVGNTRTGQVRQTNDWYIESLE